MATDSIFLGIDTGGTFTDFVLYRGGRITIHKVLSTPGAPEQAILQGIADLQLEQAVHAAQVAIVHGSTVATNAALEGKGVRTALITNRGFKDLLTIGRQTRRELYQLQPAPVTPPVPPELCLEIDCRLDANGQIVKDIEATELQRLVQQVAALQPQAVAINLLFSYLDSDQEQRVEQALPDNMFVSRSSFVLPEYKEYERGIATWLNAYLGPLVQRYLQTLQQRTAPAPLAIMQSSGGTIDAAQAGRHAVNLLLSGPAGGLAAAKFIGEQCQARGLMTFDMGGTSTDVALIQDELKITTEGKLGPYPVAVPMVDLHTIGAGGGSIAYLDAGGLLQVGPQSAGADPGPACYGLGGTQPTVTDANVVLGRLPGQLKLAGNLSLDKEAARTAVASVAEPLQLSLESTAQGIIDLANEHMARALRVISVQRGYLPQDFHLCSFGGAGGLHVCALAESLNMTDAIVPRFSGVLSALGMLVAPRERQLSHTQQYLLAALSAAEIERWLQRLFERGQRELVAEGVDTATVQTQASLDLRYQGQSYCLTIPYHDFDSCAEQFHSLHQQRYGHRLNRAIELVTVRQRTFCPTATIAVPPPTSAIAKPETYQTELVEMGLVPVYQREQLSVATQLPGPALICEPVATTLVSPGWHMTVDAIGNLRLRRST